MKASFSRVALFLSMFGLLVLAGCANTVGIDPFRTEISGTFSVSPGADGVTTTKTLKCQIKKGLRLTPTQIELYTNPKTAYRVVDDGICEPNKNGDAVQPEVVQVSPSLAGEMAKVGVSTTTGGLVNYAVQRALQNNQKKICLGGGCINTVNQNNNYNYADGGDAFSSSNSEANANSSSAIRVGCTKDCP